VLTGVDGSGIRPVAVDQTTLLVKMWPFAKSVPVTTSSVSPLPARTDEGVTATSRGGVTIGGRSVPEGGSSYDGGLFPPLHARSSMLVAAINPARIRNAAVAMDVPPF
jgi:hypothetical protein